MLQLEEEYYSIVELETSWENKTCIHVELRNFIFFSIWFGIVLYINRWFVINERYNFSFNYLLLQRDFRGTNSARKALKFFAYFHI